MANIIEFNGKRVAEVLHKEDEMPLITLCLPAVTAEDEHDPDLLYFDVKGGLRLVFRKGEYIGWEKTDG